MGFLGQDPRMWCDNTLREMSFRALGAKLELPERFAEFSLLDPRNAGGSFLLLEGLLTLLQPKAPEGNSSDEFPKFNGALGFLDFAVTVRLRRVTKRPTDGR